MSTRTEYAHGEFSWVDLSSHDMGGAKEFYGNLFGWTAEDQETAGGPPYAMFKKGGKIVGGLGQLNDEMKAQGVPPMWNSYVNVDDAKRAHGWVGEQTTLQLFQWHGQTFAIPRDGRRFLKNDLCANQAFVIGRDGVDHLGMQFHVEMTPELVRSWATDADGVVEIDQAFERQGGAGVQRGAPAAVAGGPASSRSRRPGL